MNITELIEEYKPNLDKMLDYYKSLEPLKKVTEKATLAIGHDGKKYRHQWLIKKKILEKAAKRLLDGVNEINNCNSFEDLIKLVEEKTKDLKGFGELAIYDTSSRIGAKKNIYPCKVYIHAGTKEGCKALGLDDKLKTLKVQNLPEPIKDHLEPYEIEDFLCIYRNKVRKTNVVSNISQPIRQL
jgi:hypothetical protein